MSQYKSEIMQLSPRVILEGELSGILKTIRKTKKKEVINNLTVRANTLRRQIEVEREKEMMTPHDKAQLVKLVQQIPTTTKCSDCKNMKGGMCVLAQAAPPPEVLETGCEMWVFDEISPPF